MIDFSLDLITVLYEECESSSRFLWNFAMAEKPSRRYAIPNRRLGGGSASQTLAHLPASVGHPVSLLATTSAICWYFLPVNEMYCVASLSARVSDN